MTRIQSDRDYIKLWREVEHRLGQGIRSVALLAARQAPKPDLADAHLHDVPTITACVTGIVRVRHAHGFVDLKPGESLAIAPGAWHQHDPLRIGCSLYGHGLSRTFSDVQFRDSKRNWTILLPREPSRSLLTHLINETNPGLRIVLVEKLVAQSLESTSSPMQEQTAIARMDHFMWKNLHRPIAAKQILAASGLGERHAHRLFLSFYGTTPKRYILAAHLALAAQFLHEGASVSEAAICSGFINRTHLTRAWRQAYGQPPSQWTPRIPPIITPAP